MKSLGLFFVALVMAAAGVAAVVAMVQMQDHRQAVDVVLFVTLELVMSVCVLMASALMVVFFSHALDAWDKRMWGVLGYGLAGLLMNGTAAVAFSIAVTSVLERQNPVVTILMVGGTIVMSYMTTYPYEEVRDIVMRMRDPSREEPAKLTEAQVGMLAKQNKA